MLFLIFSAFPFAGEYRSGRGHGAFIPSAEKPRRVLFNYLNITTLAEGEPGGGSARVSRYAACQPYYGVWALGGGGLSVTSPVHRSSHLVIVQI